MAAGKGKTLAAEKIGKLKTVVQLTCISLYLGKVSLQIDFKSTLPNDMHIQLVGLLKWAGDITLLAATLITVLSGIIYLSKYWKFFLDEEV